MILVKLARIARMDLPDAGGAGQPPASASIA
jgi:hypothetical protein